MVGKENSLGWLWVQRKEVEKELSWEVMMKQKLWEELRVRLKEKLMGAKRQQKQQQNKNNNKICSERK